MVAGSHDHAAIGLRLGPPLNYPNRPCTSSRVPQKEVQFISTWPLFTSADPFTLVHVSPRDSLSGYLLDQGSAMATYALMDTTG